MLVNHSVSLSLPDSISVSRSIISVFGSFRVGCFRAFKRLLGRGADPNILVPGGVSPFHIAVGIEDVDLSEEMTRLILEAGGDPNLRYVVCLPACLPVCLPACLSVCLSVVSSVVSSDRRLTRSVDQVTPLHIAAAFGRCVNVQQLLAFGADPFLLDEVTCLLHPSTPSVSLRLRRLFHSPRSASESTAGVQ